MNALVAPSRLLPVAAGLLVELVSFQFLFALAATAVLARLMVLARLDRTPPTPSPAAHGGDG